MMTPRSLHIIVASGPRDASRAVLGLVMASAAAADGLAVSVYLTMEGAQLVNVDHCGKELVRGFPSVAELVEMIVAGGGEVAYCPTCVGGDCASTVEAKMTPRDACQLAKPRGLAGYARMLAEVPTIVV